MMRLWPAIALALFGVTSVAHADESAESLFAQATEARAKGDYATACPKFAESQRLEPAPGTLLNLADCETRAGSIVSAREHFGLAATGFPRNDPRRAFALEQAAALEKRFAHLTLRLAPSAGPASVRKGSAIVDSSMLGTAVPTDPGDVVIVVSARGRLDRTYPLHLADGESMDRTVDVGPPEPVAEAKPRTSVRRTIGIVVGSVGLASLAVGAVTGVLAIGKASTVKDHCGPDNLCDAEGFAAASDGNVLSPLSTATFIAGGVLLATGTVLFLTGGDRARTSVAFMASPFGARAALSYAF